jgi:hypothetical protein
VVTYTFSRGSSGAILDRVAHSCSGVTTGSLGIAPVYIPVTDHRPISAARLFTHPGLRNALPLLPTALSSSFP